MARIYYRMIVAGKMTVDDVPEKWREEVRGLLDDD